MDRTRKIVCPDCGETANEPTSVDRRGFLTAAATAAAAVTVPLWAVPSASAAPTPNSGAEKLVKTLYEKLTDEQKKAVCFAWDFKDGRGLLRTHVSNNWQITKPAVDSDFYTKEQKEVIYEIFKGVFNPEWHKKLLKQLKDDSGGDFGHHQSIAIFGTPGTGKFQYVMTGRHMTIRADGDSEAHVALGGPIFHGHAASGFTEKVHHPGNIFWHQAELANKVYTILDGKQQEKALVPRRPAEAAVSFRGKDGKFPGLAVSDMTKDQQEAVQKVLLSLLDPYRQEDRDEVMACLKAQGGLEKCNLAFYKDGDIGNDGEWDNWRLEGPSFVWYFRGSPHVHIWINVADDSSVPLNSKG
jgi:Protein of unknown function (DUF3500)